MILVFKGRHNVGPCRVIPYLPIKLQGFSFEPIRRPICTTQAVAIVADKMARVQFSLQHLNVTVCCCVSNGKG